MKTLITRSLPWLSLALLGCEGVDTSSSDTSVDKCQKDLGTVRVDKGTWTISGNGGRSECANERLNTNDLRLTAGPIGFAQDANGVLTLAGNTELPSDVSVSLQSSTVSGSCVDFTLIENDARPGGTGLVSYHFAGTVGADGNLNGTYSLAGPASCVGDGRFIARPSAL